jgi:hypothetical protein
MKYVHLQHFNTPNTQHQFQTKWLNSPNRVSSTSNIQCMELSNLIISGTIYTSKIRLRKFYMG